ncbi:unnamed protein product [Ectocarpus sp. 6 AP-2014]
MGGRRWSESLLPTAESTPGWKLPDDGQHGQEDGEDDGGLEEETGSLCSLQSHVTFASLPSYMRSKSGLEMDPDRYRRRKQLISNLPEADSANRQMKRVATNWDPQKQTPLLGFDCVSLGPTEFKELFRRNFGVLLHPGDLGVLVSMYDKQGEGRADSAEFLKDFWQIGRDERELQARKRIQMVRKLNIEQNERLRERADRRSKVKEVAVERHTEDHVRSAIAKTTRVAERYVVSRDQGFRQLERGGMMGPTTFREQLRTIFGLRLTRAEVGGLISALDLHRDGMVDAKEFAFRFHTLARDSHAAKVAEGQARNETARRRNREQEEKLLTKLREQSKCKVNWNFSEDELKRGLKMIAVAASTYDKARLGADINRIAQMKMDPTAFRAQLLMNFRVRLGPGELGAVFTAFDKDNSKLIDGTELMHEFFRMGREERAKNLAEAKRQRHRADLKEKTFRQRLEDRFIEQTAAKVVWPRLMYDPFDDDYNMDDHDPATSVGSTSLSKSVGDNKSRGRSNNDNSNEPGDVSREPSARRRRRPKISASTAEFLAQIRKEEMTIRAMTCRGRRRKNGDSNRHNGGGGDSCHLFSYPGGPRTATAAGLPSTSPARPMTSSLKGSINNSDPNRNVHTRAETAAARAPGRRREVNPEQRDGEEEAVGASSAATDDAEELALPPSRLNPRAVGHSASFSTDDGRVSTATSVSTARGSTARSSRGGGSRSSSFTASGRGFEPNFGQTIFEHGGVVGGDEVW